MAKCVLNSWGVTKHRRLRRDRVQPDRHRPDAEDAGRPPRGLRRRVRFRNRAASRASRSRRPKANRFQASVSWHAFMRSSLAARPLENLPPRTPADEPAREYVPPRKAIPGCLPLAVDAADRVAGVSAGDGLALGGRLMRLDLGCVKKPTCRARLVHLRADFSSAFVATH